MSDLDVKTRAENIADYELKEIFEHLDFARTYTNPMSEVANACDDVDLWRGDRGKVFEAWAKTFTGNEDDDLWERVEAGMKLLQA